MKILLIGGGGREHAIAEGIKTSKHNPSLYAVMAKKNPGIAALCEDFLLEKETEIEKVVEYANREISKWHLWARKLRLQQELPTLSGKPGFL